MNTLLQINTNVGWNSTGRIAEDIGRAAIDRGWQSYIAYGRNMDGAPSSSSRLIRVGNDLDVWKHGISTRLFDRHGLSSQRATINLLKRIEDITPDIIHLHNIHGYYLNFKELFGYLQRTGISVVWTLHDSWAFTGHCAFFDMAQCRKWLNGCMKCPLRSMYPASLFLDKSASNYEIKKAFFTSLENMHIVCVSHWLNDVVRDSFLNKYPSYVIHNGVSMPKNLRKNVRREKLILGASSVWNSLKGLETFHELRRRLTPDYRIVLIGLTPGQIRQLPEGIEGLPRINERGTLYQWYQRAAVFVNPSLSETLSISNIEAQSCGTPVVTYDSGGMRETISQDTGILVGRGDIDGLVRAIKRIINNPGQFRADTCMSHIKNNFNKENCYHTYIDLYESILESRKIKIPDIVTF